VVVENVSGAGGSIGVGRAVRAAPDGYTLSIGNWLSHVGASAVYPVQYDVLKDFEPVSLLTNSPILITARKDFPANDLKELIAWLKAIPAIPMGPLMDSAESSRCWCRNHAISRATISLAMSLRLAWLIYPNRWMTPCFQAVFQRRRSCPYER